MEKYNIRIEGDFTTTVFYQKVLRQLHIYYKDFVDNVVVFDLSMTTRIDPLIIPNLLCVGEILRDTTGHPAVINTLNFVRGNRIKKYLEDIGFVDLAFGIYEFYDAGSDNQKSTIREYCKSYCFKDENATKKQIAQKISRESRELFIRHLNNFFEEDEYFGYMNIFAKFASEMCHNSIHHGNAFSYMTIQSISSINRVKIAVSDCGVGFYRSLLKKIINENLEHPFYTIDEEKFLSAKIDQITLNTILECSFYRYFDEEYGLWNIAKRVINGDGVIRIHSNNAQIILTSNLFPIILKTCKDEESLKSVLTKEFIRRKNYNYRDKLKFPGVHIEIEMPLNKSQTGRRSI